MLTDKTKKMIDTRWNNYYAKKQEALAVVIEKDLVKAKLTFDPKVPLTVAKTIIKRKK